MPETAAARARFTDSHAHLAMAAARLGEEELRAVLASYASAEGPLLVDIGTGPGDLGERRAFAERLGGGGLPAGLRLTAGIWPGRPALDDPEASLRALEASIRTAGAAGLRVAALGECGLDFHHLEAPPGVQARLFALQCGLARSLGLPLVVHSREAFRETLELLRAEARGLPVLIHCFGYGRDEARAFLDSGFLLSFAGNLTYRKAEGLREALALAPRDRLLLETDAPYMNPEPRRGRPSSPADIGRSYLAAAELRREDPEELAETVSANARSFFGPP